MQSSGGGARVSIDDRRAWFRGVITHFQQQCVEWRRFDGTTPVLSRSVTSLAESYNVKSLLVHLREKLTREAPGSPTEKERGGDPPNVKERHKREREQKREAEKKRRRKEQERKRLGDGEQSSSTKPKNTAWKARPANIPDAEWGKLREATRKKYPNFCHAYLIGQAGCTKPGCKHGSHSPPADWQSFLSEQGF